jgi:hypothetical protein
MILGRRSRLFAFAFTAVTVTAAASWAATVASIWLPVDERALPVLRTTAAVSSVALMFMLAMRWLNGGAITYLLDAMLTQRAQNRDRKPPTIPFPRVVR